ncbi:unnamed protein product, partial [Caretta caretta]
SCQNGGTYNGIECICAPGFSGLMCASHDTSKACQNGSTPIVIGTTLAFFQSSGTSPVRHEFSKIMANGSAITAASSFSTLGCNSSGPRELTALPGPPLPGPLPPQLAPPPSTVSPPTTSQNTTTPHTTSQKTTMTTTPHTITTTTRSTTTQDTCENGGTWMNGGCQYTSSFQGPKCEYVTEVIEVKAEVNVTVDMKLQITSHKFTPELKDNTTQEYKNFTLDFKQQMKLVYSNVPEYKDVVILKLT